MERREHPRSPILKGSGITTKLILSGGSLLNTTSPRSIEIGAIPLNISQGGICLLLRLDVPWETLTPTKKVSLLVTYGDQGWLLPATVARREKDFRTIGLRFAKPLSTLAPLLTPPELQ